MHINVSAETVRVLAKSLAKSVPGIPHNKMIHLIATSLGWSGDALMHHLNASETDDPKIKRARNEGVFRACLREIENGDFVNAYVIAKEWEPVLPYHMVMKAIALLEFEPRLACSLARKAFAVEPALVAASLIWPTSVDGRDFDARLPDRCFKRSPLSFNVRYSELLGGFGVHIRNRQLARLKSVSKMWLVYEVVSERPLDLEVNLPSREDFVRLLAEISVASFEGDRP